MTSQFLMAVVEIIVDAANGTEFQSDPLAIIRFLLDDTANLVSWKPKPLVRLYNTYHGSNTQIQLTYTVCQSPSLSV